MSMSELYEHLRERTLDRPGSGTRTMMGHPATTIAGKIAFFLREPAGLVFKLGDLSAHPSIPSERLTPFAPMKTRKPMTGWYVYTGVDASEAEALAEIAIREVS